MTDARSQPTLGQILFTSNQAPGAIPNGVRIVKTVAIPGDRPVGSKGTVRGSIGEHGIYGYFIEWDNRPGVPVFVASYKIEREQ